MRSGLGSQNCLEIRLDSKPIEIVPYRCFFVSLQALTMVRMYRDNGYRQHEASYQTIYSISSPQYLGDSCLF
jgi:hypothetical protein